MRALIEVGEFPRAEKERNISFTLYQKWIDDVIICVFVVSWYVENSNEVSQGGPIVHYYISDIFTDINKSSCGKKVNREETLILFISSSRQSLIVDNLVTLRINVCRFPASIARYT